ncbi:MAG: MFS transporter [Firmicutes bacterium]|nr:MFS transporter [Bacillota bacterium]
MPEPDYIWTRNFILLCLVNFILFVGTQLLFPSVPMYLLTRGGNAKDVGYVMGAYTISAMVIRPLAGWLVDNYGRKKVMVFGMLMMLIAALLYRLAVDVPTTTWIRILHGMAFGMASTAIGTIVVDSLPLTRLNEGMGYFGMTSTLSMALAPMIGFGLVGQYGYPTLFLAVAVLSGVALGSCFLVRTANAPLNTSGTSVTGIWANLAEKTALPAAGVIFFLAAVYGSVLSYIALYALERGIANIGLFFTAMALTMLISRPLSGRWADEGGSNWVLLVGHLALVAGMMTTGLAHTMTSFLAAGAFIGIGFGFCLPVLQAQAVRYTPVHRRGSAIGTFYATFDLGIGLGTIVWGYVAAATSYQTMYFTNLLPLVLAGIVYYQFTVSREDK